MRGEVFAIGWRAALVGVVLLALGLPAHTQVGGAVGGIPSRLRVQHSLGVGTAPPAGAGDIAADDITGDVVTATTFSGSGASLTALNASNLSSGTVADARLSSNVPLLDAGNVFTNSPQTLRNDAAYLAFQNSAGTPNGYVGDGGSGNDIQLDAANALQLTSGGALTLNGVNATDYARLSQSNVMTASSPLRVAVDTGSLLFYDTSNTTRTGYLQFDTTGGVYLNSDLASRPLRLITNGGVIYGSSDGGSSYVDMTPSSGTFTLSYTNACTTTQTQSARWYKIGSVVAITVAAAMATCTGDTTTFDTDAGDVPAAIAPTTSNVYGPRVEANNNGANVEAMVEIATNGEVIINRCGAVTGTCDGGAWTGSGNRALDAWTVSYVR